METILIKFTKKVCKKLNTLAQILSYTTLDKRKILMKGFITSQFGYRSLVWMFRSKILGRKINELPERALKIIYGDKTSSFNELLEKDNFVSVHHKNLQALAIEMYKISNHMFPTIIIFLHQGLRLITYKAE